MRVYDLRCTQGHGFEGWFGSEADFASQQARGLVTCPLCADAGVVRMPSAPRLNLQHHAKGEAPATAAAVAADAAPPSAVDGETHAAHPAGARAAPAPMRDAQAPLDFAALRQVLLMKAVRHVLANTEDVGPRFAEEARRIHHGESEARGIRGQASDEEREALADEGIEVMALPVPRGLVDPTH